MLLHKSNRFTIPIYYGYLFVVFSDDFETSAKRLTLPLGNMPLKYFGAATWGIHNKNNVAEYYVFFPADPKPSSVAHESLHVANWILGDSGVVLDTRNDEPQAYLLGWVVDRVYEALKQANNGNKN